MVETVPTVTAEQSVTEKKAPPLNPDPDLMVNAEGDQVALKNAKEIGRQWVDQNGATDE